MKLKDLLIPLSSHTYIDIYDSAGVPITSARADDFQHYIYTTKRENPRKRLKPMYYAKVVHVLIDNYDYVGDFRALGIQIDYEE